jgi:uncharacterized protein (TIGR00369 family)
MSSTLEDFNDVFVGRTPHIREVGLRITEFERGRGTMTMPARADWMGDPERGLMHPGALTVLADTTCGLAVGTALAEVAPFATLDLRMDYLRPAGPDRDVHCSAECYRTTRSVAFVRAELWQDDPLAPIAAAQANFMLSTPGGPRPAADARRPSELPDPSDGPGARPQGATDWQPPAAAEPVRPRIPYVEFLGIRVAPDPVRPLLRLPFQPKLVGNPMLPALHGGVIAGFAETAAWLHLVGTLRGEKLPKGIDFSIDYLRSGRPEETFAGCEIVRVGSRVALVQVRCWQRDPANPIAVARAQFLLTRPQPG